MNTTSSHSAAVDLAVDTYATKLLKRASPVEACIDADKLGPYVTSMLRKDVSNESLLELLQEQCSMSSNQAELTLDIILYSVQTGIVGGLFAGSHYPVQAPCGSPFMSPDKIVPLTNTMTPSHFTRSGMAPSQYTPIDQGMQRLCETPSEAAFPPSGSTAASSTKKHKRQSSDGTNIAAEAFEPRQRYVSLDESQRMLHAARLESDFPPLGSTPASSSKKHKRLSSDGTNVAASDFEPRLISFNGSQRMMHASLLESDFPPLGTTPALSSKKHKRLSSDGTNVGTGIFEPRQRLISLDESDGMHMAAASFHTRQISIDDKPPAKKRLSDGTNVNAPAFYPKLREISREDESRGTSMSSLPPSVSGLQLRESFLMVDSSAARAYVLFSKFPDLSTVAAFEAARWTKSEAAAIHLIKRALNAPHVCRPFLQGWCPRTGQGRRGRAMRNNQCQESHDLDYKVCSFWLQTPTGCRDGEKCIFRHDFPARMIDQAKLSAAMDASQCNECSEDMSMG